MLREVKGEVISRALSEKGGHELTKCAIRRATLLLLLLLRSHYCPLITSLWPVSLTLSVMRQRNASLRLQTITAHLLINRLRCSYHSAQRFSFQPSRYQDTFGRRAGLVSQCHQSLSLLLDAVNKDGPTVSSGDCRFSRSN